MAIFVFFAAATCLSAKVDTTQGTGLPQKCSLNPFSAQLKRKNVELFQSPIWNETSHCGNEWQRFGLCCNKTQLFEFAKADQANIDRSVEAVLRSLSRTLASYESAMDKADKIENNEFGLLSKKTIPLLKVLQAKSSIDFRDKLRRLLRQQNFDPELRRCWKKISGSRSNALCSVCSGRSRTFFSDNRIMMFGTDCSMILDKCAPSFKDLVLIIELLAEHSKGLIELVGKTWPGISGEIKYLKNLTDIIKSQDIHRSTQRYLNTTGKKRAQIAASLCSKFLNINSMTFVEKLESLLVNLEFFKMENFMSRVVKNASERKNKKPQNKVLRRQLTSNQLHSSELPVFPQADNPNLNPSSIPQILLPYDSLFKGDVKILFVDQDTSTHSNFLINGSNASGQNAGQGINITNKFP